MAPTLTDDSRLALPEIEERLLGYVRTELVGPAATVERDDELLAGDVLDSVAVLRLATFVAEEFDFEIQPEDFVVENFQSVAILAGYVLRAAGGDR